MSRESKITVATGDKGGGKSYRTLWDIIVPYVKGLLNGGIPRRAVIFDPNNEYQFSTNTNNNIYPKTDEHRKITNNSPLEIKAIHPNDLRKFSVQKRVEIRRVAPFYENDVMDKKGKIIARKGSMMSISDKVKLLVETVNNFNNGLLLIEDLRSLFGNNIPHNIISLIVSNRHRNLDVVWHLQSCGRMLPEFWENVNFVRFHLEKGSIDYHETKLQERYAMFKICDILVRKVSETGNARYFVWCDMDAQKIRGQYTKEMLYWCIEKFIKQTANTTKSLEREKNNDGKARYTYDQCVSIKKDEFFKTFYGNQ
jgi:hypothetical protein